MRSNLALLGLVLIGSFTFAVERTTNSCWSTQLDLNEKHICRTCESHVEAHYESACSQEIEDAQILEQALQGSVVNDELFNKAYELWTNAITLRDNCKTSLINECFDSSQEGE